MQVLGWLCCMKPAQWWLQTLSQPPFLSSPARGNMRIPEHTTVFWSCNFFLHGPSVFIVNLWSMSGSSRNRKGWCISHLSLSRQDNFSSCRAVAALFLLSGVSASWVSTRTEGLGVSCLPEASAEFWVSFACLWPHRPAFPFLSEETHSAPQTVFGSCLVLLLVCVCVCVSSSKVVFTACSCDLLKPLFWPLENLVRLLQTPLHGVSGLPWGDFIFSARRGAMWVAHFKLFHRYALKRTLAELELT